MQASTLHNAETRRVSTDKFIALEQVNRSHVATEEAAFYLARKPQTLRTWACKEDGPLRPIRVNGRLAWPVSEIRRVLGLAQ